MDTVNALIDRALEPNETTTASTGPRTRPSSCSRTRSARRTRCGTRRRRLTDALPRAALRHARPRGVARATGPVHDRGAGRRCARAARPLGIERVARAGVSIGGAAAVARRERARAHRAPGRLLHGDHLPPAETWADRAATVRAEGMEAVTVAALERWLSPEAPAAMRERLRADLVATPPEGYAACCEAIGANDLREPSARSSADARGRRRRRSRHPAGEGARRSPA